MEEQVINTVDFHQTPQCHVCHLNMQKHVQQIMQHSCYYPNTASPIQCISFITKLINALHLVNIPPDYTPETITKVSTTVRNIIHNLTIQINNIIMGITITGSNTAYSITNINSPMVTHLPGFQLQHLMIIIYFLQVLQHERKQYTFNLSKSQSTISTGTKYYT